MKPLEKRPTPEVNALLSELTTKPIAESLVTLAMKLVSMEQRLGASRETLADVAANSSSSRLRRLAEQTLILTKP